MSQHDFNIANQGFPATRADINNAFQAIASNSSGPTAPSTTYANMWWYDETNNKMYLRNEADSAWIEVATIDQTNNEWQITTGQISAVDGDGLVFKTDDGITRLTISDAGGITVASGLTVDNDGATVLTVDRGTSDGTIVEVQKGGTAVGSLFTYNASEFGISSSNDLILTQNTTTQRNILFRDSFIGPFGGDNNTLDLGRSVGRWKDLYLAGGAYLGGTGSANYLDDYEEGTWTPAVSSHTGSTSGQTINGRYVKVGRVCHIQGVFTQGSGTVTGTLSLTGLPFNGSGTFGHITINSSNSSPNIQISAGRLTAGQSQFNLKDYDGDGIASGSGDINIVFFASYEV